MTMTDKYDEDQEPCPGEDECDDEYCNERVVHYIEIEYSVKFEIRAHSEDEALQLAWAVDIDAHEPQDGRVENWDTEIDVTVETDASRRAYQERIQRLIGEADTAEVTT